MATCGECARFVDIPLEDGQSEEDRIGVCPYDWSIDLVENRPLFTGHLLDDPACEEGFVAR